MTREEFIEHTRERVEASIRSCEAAIGRSLPRKLEFQWLSPKRPLVSEGIEEEICREVFVSPEQIYACVDIGPWKQDGDRLLICALIAGYPPAPFGKNRLGEEGPFILVRGGDFAR